MTSFYDAFVRNADFADKSTLDMINEWGKEKSGGLIPSVIEEINKNSILYALNCVSFKARWMSEFSMNSTKKESFTDINGNVKDVMMMNKEDISLYNDNGKWKTLCLPFGRGFYRMFILLPNESYGLATLVEELNSSSWNETVSSMKSKRVDIKLPKFETSTNITLNEVMQELGVVDAFDKEDANFTNMVDGYNVVVDFLNQSCRIKVDEEGVEAASITLGQLDGADMPDESGKLKFHADRPFVYMIQDISSGAIFFTGVKCK